LVPFVDVIVGGGLRLKALMFAGAMRLVQCGWCNAAGASPLVHPGAA